MFIRITSSVGSLFTSIAALAGAAILGCGAASADPNQDDQFLALLSQKGVSALSGVPSLIETAHKICSRLDAGMSADAVVDALIDNANNVTPGADQGRLARSQARFLAAAVEVYCPNNQGSLAFASPAGWHSPTHRVVFASFIQGINPPNPPPPAPAVDIQTQIPPQSVAPPPTRKTAPPVAGPLPGGGGGGGTGDGPNGSIPKPPSGPGIIALVP